MSDDDNAPVERREPLRVVWTAAPEAGPSLAAAPQGILGDQLQEPPAEVAAAVAGPSGQRSDAAAPVEGTTAAPLSLIHI